jgi:hypothetical protein
VNELQGFTTLKQLTPIKGKIERLNQIEAIQQIQEQEQQRNHHWLIQLQ